MNREQKSTGVLTRSKVCDMLRASIIPGVSLDGLADARSGGCISFLRRLQSYGNQHHTIVVSGNGNILEATSELRKV